MQFVYRAKKIVLLLIIISLVPFVKGFCQLVDEVHYSKYPPFSFLQQSSTSTVFISEMIKQGISIEKQFPDSAMALYAKAYILSKEKRYVEGTVNALFYSAKLNTRLFKPEKAIVLYHEAISYYRYPIQDTLLMYQILNSLGVQYGMMGDYKKAAQCFYSIINASQRLQTAIDSREVVRTYINLSTVKDRLNDNFQAMKYADKAVEISRRKRYFNDLAVALGNKGNGYESLKMNDSAILYYENALNLSIQLKDSIHILENYINIGRFLLDGKRVNEAIVPLIKGEEIANRMTQPITYRKLNLWNLSGRVYFHLKQYDIAESYLLKSLKLANESGIIENVNMTYKTLGEVYEATNRSAKALTYFHLYKNMQDSLLSLGKVKDINELEIKYRTEQKDKDLAHRQLEISKQQNQLQQKNLWMTAISAGLIIVLLFSIGYYYRYKNSKKQQENHLAFLHQRQEMEKMQSMMKGEEKERNRIGQELHDGIGGMLAAVNMNLRAIQHRNQDISEINELSIVMQQLQETAIEVRKMAHNLMPDILLKYTLPEALQLFCEQMSYNKNFTVEFHSFGDFASVGRNISLAVYRMIQELIQNVIKHAHATRTEVQLTLLDDVLNITVEDNGVGFDTEDKMDGRGLNLLQTRVLALKGFFSVTSKPGRGTVAFIEFNILNL